LRQPGFADARVFVAEKSTHLVCFGPRRLDPDLFADPIGAVPPGSTTDGRLVSGRGSRLDATGNVMLADRG
jgi:hypothetical protein